MCCRRPFSRWGLLTIGSFTSWIHRCQLSHLLMKSVPETSAKTFMSRYLTCHLMWKTITSTRWTVMHSDITCVWLSSIPMVLWMTYSDSMCLAFTVADCVQYAVECNPAVCFRDDRSCEGAEGEKRQWGGGPSSHQGAPERANQGLENIAVLTLRLLSSVGGEVPQGVYHSECIVVRDSELYLFTLVQLRLMNSELVVEDVVRDRSMKVGLVQSLHTLTKLLFNNYSLQVFRERCWKAYKPPDL